MWRRNADNKPREDSLTLPQALGDGWLRRRRRSSWLADRARQIVSCLQYACVTARYRWRNGVSRYAGAGGGRRAGRTGGGGRAESAWHRVRGHRAEDGGLAPAAPGQDDPHQDDGGPAAP